MSVDITKLRSASFMPGLQNIGTASVTATISGVMPNAGNLVGSFVVNFPNSGPVMSQFRVTLPDANGDLANFWFPIMGTIELYDATVQYTLVMYIGGAETGRSIYFNFINSTATPHTFTNFRISVFADLYTYPWK